MCGDSTGDTCSEHRLRTAKDARKSHALGDIALTILGKAWYTSFPIMHYI
jgi:hypothetical protein